MKLIYYTYKYDVRKRYKHLLCFIPNFSNKKNGNIENIQPPPPPPRARARWRNEYIYILTHTHKQKNETSCDSYLRYCQVYSTITQQVTVNILIQIIHPCIKPIIALSH